MVKFTGIFYKLFLILLILNASALNLNSQIRNELITGAIKGELDTLAFETTKKIVKEATGLQEEPIDPDAYIIGPNDELLILIVATQPRQFKVKVSADGMLAIPTVGSINLKNKSLTEARKLIVEKAQKIYKTDEISVTISELRQFKVIVSGNVHKPNLVPATAVDRVSEVIEKAGGMKYNSSVRHIKLYRKLTNEFFKVDILKFLRGLDKNANPTVLDGDMIIVPELNENSTIGIFGDVPSEGEFEYVEGDSLSTLFRFALGFFDSALLDSVELIRYVSSYYSERILLNLSDWRNRFYLNLPLNNDIPLKAGDRVFVPKRSDWTMASKVAVKGEVKYPGHYAIAKNKDRVSDILKRAGGFTQDASLEAAELIRQKEFKTRDEEMERLWRTPPSEMSENELRYFQARVREKKGYMAINFRKILEDPTVSDNILLEDEDSIYVPPKKIFVNVQGRVNNPGLVLYNPAYNYLDYIIAAGGFGFRADEDETLVVKSKGEQFLAKDMNYKLEPGDNILVPPQKEVSFWKIITEGLTVAVQLASIVGLVISLMALSKQ